MTNFASSMTGRKIILVPDKFKGTATAPEVAEALETALRRFSVFGRDPSKLDMVRLPLADGGDGSLEVMAHALGDRCRIVNFPTYSAMQKDIEVPVLLCEDFAFIEMAKVCGVAGIPFEERNPETATTRGLGILMREVAKSGVKKIILGLGGSATNDGGAGMVAECPPYLLKDVEICAACDVANPLLGPNGATMVFGPQKGAGPDMLERLERRMEAWASEAGLDVTLAGGGAAGGVGAALHSLYGATLTPGWKLFGDMVGLEEQIASSNLVITGEGRFDEQSLNGKLIDGIASLCRKWHKPLKVVCGKTTLSYKVWKKAGIADVLTLTEIEPDIRKSISRTKSLLSGEGLVIAGCDEAGRGCLAGPVFAAAVVLPEGFYDPRLNDSKQMSEADRDALRVIIEREAVAWSVVAVSAEEIDRINILNASITGMHRALDGISGGAAGLRLDMILVDGNRFLSYRSPDDRHIPHHCVVHGDASVAAIAASSVLAKTHRDEYMRALAKEYPQYGWDRNMAYPTTEHREAIRRYGITPYHRRSYALLPEGEPLLF